MEGHVNRLKFIKRMMYGRANFDLLRKRVLLQDQYLAGWFHAKLWKSQFQIAVDITEENVFQPTAGSGSTRTCFNYSLQSETVVGKAHNIIGRE